MIHDALCGLFLTSVRTLGPRSPFTFMRTPVTKQLADAPVLATKATPESRAAVVPPFVYTVRSRRGSKKKKKLLAKVVEIARVIVLHNSC